MGIDDDQGSRLVARHLIGLGHRNIVYVRTSREVSLRFSVQQRYDSFVKACLEQGVTPTTLVAQESEDRISTIVSELLSLPQMPTAIACQEDGIAIPLIYQLPSDISVIGYDDSFYAHDIGLTTIRQDPIGMAREAACKTLDLINRKTTGMPFQTFPAQLIVRSSTSRVSLDKG